MGALASAAPASEPPPASESFADASGSEPASTPSAVGPFAAPLSPEPDAFAPDPGDGVVAELLCAICASEVPLHAPSTQAASVTQVESEREDGRAERRLTLLSLAASSPVSRHSTHRDVDCSNEKRKRLSRDTLASHERGSTAPHLFILEAATFELHRNDALTPQRRARVSGTAPFPRRHPRRPQSPSTEGDALHADGTHAQTARPPISSASRDGSPDRASSFPQHASKRSEAARPWAPKPRML